MESKPVFKPNPKLKLMDQVLEILRYYHYAYRTEQSYYKWILIISGFYKGKNILGTAVQIRRIARGAVSTAFFCIFSL